MQLYDVMREFAAAGRRREPNERFWQFYEIVARTRNDPNRMTLAEGSWKRRIWWTLHSPGSIRVSW